MNTIEWLQNNWGTILFLSLIVILFFQQQIKDWWNKRKTTIGPHAPPPPPPLPTEWSMTPSDTLYTSSGVEEPEVQLKRQLDEAIIKLEQIRKEGQALAEKEKKDILECNRKRAWYKNRKEILAVQYNTYDAQARMTSQMIERQRK